MLLGAAVDSADIVLAGTGFVATVVLGALAIWISLRLHHEASTHSQHASQELIEIRSLLDTMRRELPDSISSLHHLRDSLLTLPDVHFPASKRVHSLETVAVEEKTVEHEVWVLAVTIEYEVASVYQSIIAANIRSGRFYTYFLPIDIRGGLDHSLNRLLTSLRAQGLGDEQLRAHLTVYEVPDANLLANMTLLDPNLGPKRGYLLPVYSDKEYAFQVTLDDDLHDRVAARMHAWRKDDCRRYPEPAATEAPDERPRDAP